MSKGLKIAIAVTVALILAVGIRVGLIYHANHENMQAKTPQYVEPKLTQDDMVFLRKMRPDTPKDEHALIGKTVWISAGGQMDYYRDTGNHVDYAKPVGTLPGATPLIIRSVFEEVAPKTGRAVMRIPAGDKHVLLGFTLPNSTDPKAEYAVPVGNYTDGSYNFFTDEIFFYDDPHILYKHWGPEMWSHIDKHEAVLGMSENQAMMALGEVTVPGSDEAGNRSVQFDNDGHPLTIDFVNNKAVKITPGGE